MFAACASTFKRRAASSYARFAQLHSRCLGLSPGEMLDAIDDSICDVDECSSKPCATRMLNTRGWVSPFNDFKKCK